MALINYNDYFDFAAYGKAIKAIETANREFAKSIEKLKSLGVEVKISMKYNYAKGFMKPKKTSK